MEMINTFHTWFNVPLNNLVKKLRVRKTSKIAADIFP